MYRILLEVVQLPLKDLVVLHSTTFKQSAYRENIFYMIILDKNIKSNLCTDI